MEINFNGKLTYCRGVIIIITIPVSSLHLFSKRSFYVTRPDGEKRIVLESKEGLIFFLLNQAVDLFEKIWPFFLDGCKISIFDFLSPCSSTVTALAHVSKLKCLSQDVTG